VAISSPTNAYKGIKPIRKARLPYNARLFGTDSSEIGIVHKLTFVPRIKIAYRTIKTQKELAPINPINKALPPIKSRRINIPIFLPQRSANQPMRNTRNATIPKIPCHSKK
jgi:hypothetical protein